MKNLRAIAVLPLLIGVAIAWQTWAAHPRLAISLMPVFAMFLLWYRLMSQTTEIKSSFNIVALLLSGVFVLCGMFFYRRLDPVIYGALTSLGFFAAFFVFADVADVARCVRGEPRPAMVAVIGSLTMHAYALMEKLDDLGWEKMANATILIVRGILRLFGIHSTSWTIHDGDVRAPVVVLDNFSVIIYSGCSGMEGVCLFFFLLSCILLLDWRLFSRWEVFELYAWGFLYMFVVNALRITAFILFGHWAGVGEEAITEIFHSWIGFVLYFIAFGVFMVALYALEKRTRIKADNQ
jgi:exosortase/archaeosortase family protein